MPSGRESESIKDFRKSISGRKAAVLSGKMRNLFRKCATERGQKTEKYVEEALTALQNEGRIASFYMTKKWSRKDRQGVDAVVYLNDGTEVKRQIKSSAAGVEKHLKQQENFKEEIGVIYGNYLAGETFEEYRKRIFLNINVLSFSACGQAGACPLAK